MERTSAIGFLLFLGCFATFSFTDGCKCNINHPQERFCHADFAFAGRVNSVDGISVDGLKYFQYTLEYSRHQVYKGKQLLSTDKKNQIIITPYYGDLCGRTNLVRGEKYLISGIVENGKLVITFCDWINEWHKITPTQREFLKDGVYASHCGECEIPGSIRFQKFDQNLHRDYSNALQMSGYWSLRKCYYNPGASMYYRSEDCETDYTYCSNDTDTGMCLWKWSASYGKCFTERETLWQLQSGAQPAFTNMNQCHEITSAKLKRKCKRAILKQRKFRKQQKIERQQQGAEEEPRVQRIPFDLDLDN